MDINTVMTLFIRTVSRGAGLAAQVIARAPLFAVIAAAVMEVMMAVMFFEPWDAYEAEDDSPGRQKGQKPEGSKARHRHKDVLSDYTID